MSTIVPPTGDSQSENSQCPTPGCLGDVNYAAPGRLHIAGCTYPRGADLLDHELTEDCICGPTAVPIKREDGSMGWVYEHHSLDGREASEACPYCRAPHPRQCYPGCAGGSE